MDEMKLKLSSKLMKGIASKIITKALFKKTGFNVNVGLNDIEVRFLDGDTQIHLDVDLKMDKNEFIKLVHSTDLD